MKRMTPMFQRGLLCALLAGVHSCSSHSEESMLSSWQNSAQKAADAAALISKTEPASSLASQESPSPSGPAALPLSSPAPATPAAPLSSTPSAAPAPETPAPALALLPQDETSKDKVGAVPPTTPAKKLFGTVKAPAALHPRAIGFYAKGCLAGAKSLAVDGPSWQVMRLSRNRSWGHPKLISLLERYADDVAKKDGWPGLLVGDLSQPRGGPMLTGHASHQVGLDADIWFTPMPSRRLTWTERENLAATSMLTSNSLSVNPKVWGEGQVKILRRVASYPEVERVLVHPAIKKALCQSAGSERTWLAKVRPYWGHFYHYHVRIGCPPDSVGCQKQDPVSGDDGCGKELDHWYKLLTAPPPKEPVPVKPEKPKPPMLLADLPADCRVVLNTGTEDVKIAGTPPSKKVQTPAVNTAVQVPVPKPVLVKPTEAAAN